MDIASPSLFMRAATSPSYVRGGSQKQAVSLRVGGSASLVQTVTAQQACLMDVQSLLLVVEDDLRQIDMLAPSLGLNASRTANKARGATSRVPSTPLRRSLDSGTRAEQGSVSLPSQEAAVETVVIGQSRSPNSVTSQCSTLGQPPQQSQASRRSSAGSSVEANAHHDSLSSGNALRRASNGDHSAVTVIPKDNTTSQPGTPPAYTSRRVTTGTSSMVSPPSYTRVADTAPDYPTSAFDPDAATPNASSFNASVRVRAEGGASVVPQRTSIAVNLLCPSTEEIPIQDVAAAAQRFAHAHRSKVNAMDARNDMSHEWLVGVVALSHDEQAARQRLSALLVSIGEETGRYAIYGDYDKFVVFCMENEPVWRRAARTLQQRKEERLNSTENTFARFEFVDNAMQQKSLAFQEYLDYMLSLKIVEHDELQEALRKARNRRRFNTVTNRPSDAAGDGTRHQSPGLHAEEAVSRPRAPSNSTPLTRALRRAPSDLSNGRSGNSNHSGKSTPTPAGKQSGARPAPPSVPNPNQPAPRRGGGGTQPPGAHAVAGSLPAGGVVHARVRADRLVDASSRPTATRANALTATESGPRVLAANRPLPPNHWMQVERVANP